MPPTQIFHLGLIALGATTALATFTAIILAIAKARLNKKLTKLYGPKGD